MRCLYPKRVTRFLDLIEEKKLNFLWSARTSVRCVTKEMLARMAKLGCIRLNLWIEVGNEEILKQINKRITNDMVRDGVKWAKQAGITVLGFFILGRLGPLTPIWVVFVITGCLGFTAVGYQGVGLTLLGECAGADLTGTATCLGQ